MAEMKIVKGFDARAAALGRMLWIFKYLWRTEWPKDIGLPENLDWPKTVNRPEQLVAGLIALRLKFTGWLSPERYPRLKKALTDSLTETTAFTTPELWQELLAVLYFFCDQSSCNLVRTSRKREEFKCRLSPTYSWQGRAYDSDWDGLTWLNLGTLAEELFGPQGEELPEVNEFLAELRSLPEPNRAPLIVTVGAPELPEFSLAAINRLIEENYFLKSLKALDTPAGNPILFIFLKKRMANHFFLGATRASSSATDQPSGRLMLDNTDHQPNHLVTNRNNIRTTSALITELAMVTTHLMHAESFWLLF